MKLQRWLRIGTVVTAVSTLAVLTQKPFVEPYVDKTVANAQLALERAIKRRLTPDWVGAELEAAVNSDDLARTELLLALAARNRIPVADSHISRAKKYVDREKGIVATLARCATCAADPGECKTPSVFLFCNVPVEFTVIGDAKTLAKAGSDAAAGNTVDRIDVALATVGIAAAALTPLTGGTSYTVKAGATTLRVARKMGKLGRGVGRVLNKAADIPFRWRKIDDFVRTGNLELLTDTRLLRGIAELSEHIGTVAKRAGPVETVFLLKHVERGTDAAELARVSKVAGKRTREAVELLGLAKAARAVRRLSNLLMAAIGLILAIVGQLFVLAFPMALRASSRLFTRAQ